MWAMGYYFPYFCKIENLTNTASAEANTNPLKKTQKQ